MNVYLSSCIQYTGVCRSFCVSNYIRSRLLDGFFEKDEISSIGAKQIYSSKVLRGDDEFPTQVFASKDLEAALHRRTSLAKSSSVNCPFSMIFFPLIKL